MKKSSALLLVSSILSLGWSGVHSGTESWTVESPDDWQANQSTQKNLEFMDGMAVPTAKTASYLSSLKSFPEKRTAAAVVISQSPVWENWQPVDNLGPSNLGDAPIFLSMGPGNYWMFGRYVKNEEPESGFEALEAELDGFDVPLLTTPYANQFDAPGGLKESEGGYHAWQSHDMKNWVHHGSVSDYDARWMTTAEYVDGKVYLYYDFPNDQDPHLIIDDDLTDGEIGEQMGMAFKDPSNGSDSAIIRDLDGNFHLILENWDPINASKRSWDSPLANHAVSENGIDGFELLEPAVDYRTNPTGVFAEHVHPHWHLEDPDNYPGKLVTEDFSQHRVKKGQTRAYATYEIHEPEQDAYGDWAAISVGGQYYLFGDMDPAGAHGHENMSVAWFTSSSINEPFSFCGNIGKGHPDPDVMFANGQFYLATQMSTDYISPGPWVDGVEVRVGVDTDNDGTVNQWTDWQEVKESYAPMPGFSKQVAKTPAMLDLSALPAGFGFQFELRILDTTDNESKPILDKVELSFQ